MKMKNSLLRLCAFPFAQLAGALLLANVASAQCDLYPIALSSATLANVAPGTEIDDIFNGTQPGNFGWLTWAGSPDEPTIVASLTPPGDSYTYMDPFNAANNQIGVGSWIQGKPGVSNSKAVRDALHTLEDIVINVPVWDLTTAQGNNTLYHVVGFAQVQISGYYLPHQNRISALFLGYVSCGGAD
jgi:hypothetical protein